MEINRYPCLVIGFALMAACAKETPPPSVDELLANKVLLDAMMSKCVNDRSRMKYEPECINAREAANIIARAEEAERRKFLEAQSERKRAALRRAQEAAEEARRRAEEAARARREAEYLGLFEPVAESADGGDAAAAAGPDALQEPAMDSGESIDGVTGAGAQSPTGEATTFDDAPAEVTDSDEVQDLGEIREELRRRTDGSH